MIYVLLDLHDLKHVLFKFQLHFVYCVYNFLNFDLGLDMGLCKVVDNFLAELVVFYDVK